ncbi:MAG: PEP-CTERM sorting domain-containing protein [Phycisphaerae bacterium]|nr:PEP-CTERM sorting domain-containing protein [Phycisphaerae bacterium]
MMIRGVWMYAVVAVLCTAVMADYKYPPPWDHDDETFTHQEWQFTVEQRMNVPPEVDQNPYGDPTATITNGIWDTPVGGWWDMPTNCIDMSFYIPNEADSTKQKLVWIEVKVILGMIMEEGRTGMILDDFTSDCSWGGQPEPVLLSEDLIGPDDVWYYHATWEIDPQPDEEWVSISVTHPYRVFGIHEVDIDTICIPEPMTLSLMGLAGVGLVLRRRRTT